MMTQIMSVEGITGIENTELDKPPLEANARMGLSIKVHCWTNWNRAGISVVSHLSRIAWEKRKIRGDRIRMQRAFSKSVDYTAHTRTVSPSYDCEGVASDAPAV